MNRETIVPKALKGLGEGFILHGKKKFFAEFWGGQDAVSRCPADGRKAIQRKHPYRSISATKRVPNRIDCVTRTHPNLQKEVGLLRQGQSRQRPETP